MGNAQAFSTDKIGFQVTAVSPKSPGEQAGLRVTDDFILTMNGLALPFIEPEKIMSTVKNSVNRPIMLTVYNTKTEKTRDVVLTPTSSWPGEGLLGIKIKLNTYEAVRVDVDYGDVYTKEDDYEDIVATTPKKTTPTGKSGKSFTFSDSEFSNIEEGGGGAGALGGSGAKPKSFMKRFSFTGSS